MKKIGVEKGLDSIGDYLSSQGYSVETLSEDLKSNVSKCNNLDVIITADYNTNMMGFSDTSTKTPIINASGLTQEEIKQMIDQKTTK